MSGQLSLLPSPNVAAPVTRESLGLFSERERDIYRLGFSNGLHQANNAAQPTISDLELRIANAIEALNTPAF